MTQTTESLAASAPFDRAARRETGPRNTFLRFWFAPSSPATLGFCRMLFFGLMTWWFWSVDFSIWGTLPPSFANNRVFLWRLLGFSVGDVRTLAVVEFAWKCAVLLSAVGLFTRVMTAASFLLAVYLFAVPHQFGKTGHGDGILMFTMLILAVSRSGDGWSIDSLVRAYRSRDPSRRSKPLSGEYTWPIRMAWLLMSLIFLAAAVTKLRWSGLAWITSDNLRNTILQHFYGDLSDPATGLGRWVAEHAWLCKTVAGLTIAIELLFPLAMVSRWARWILVPGMFLAQVFIYLILGVAFTQFMFVYLFWIPWADVGERFRRFAMRFGRYSMLYDGSCGLCKSVASVVARFDVLHRIEPIDALNDWPRASAAAPGALDRRRCLEDIHAVGPRGQVYTGFRAYRAMAFATPIAWLLVPLLYVPPIPFVGQRVYRYIATHRHDGGCELPSA